MSIILKDTISQYVPVAANLDSNRLQLLANEQEAYRCQKILGKALYEDITDNPTLGKNPQLITELRPVLVYWTMASFQLKGGVFNTATGAYQKRTDASVPLSEEKSNALLNEYCKMARFYESEVETFLKENIDDFPLWRGSAKLSGCKTFSIKSTTPSAEI